MNFSYNYQKEGLVSEIYSRKASYQKAWNIELILLILGNSGFLNFIGESITPTLFN